MQNTPIIDLIDDDATLCEALALVLESEAMRTRIHARTRDFLRLAPDDSCCVVTDLRMPDMTGIELLTKMREARMTAPVIVMTGHANTSLAVQAMKMGAFDFIEKPFVVESLLKALRAALAQDVGRRARDAELDACRQRLFSLTPREREILTRLVEGRLNKVIAYELGISVRTVETHRANIMEKTKMKNLSELVRIALLADDATSNAGQAEEIRRIPGKLGAFSNRVPA